MLFWHVSEPCYAFLRQCTFRISRVWVSVRLCAWLRLSVPLAVRSAPLSGPHPSQMMTRGGIRLTSNHTRVTYWKGSSASLVCLSYALAE